MKSILLAPVFFIFCLPLFAQENPSPLSSPKKEVSPLQKNLPEFDLDYEKTITKAYNEHLLSLKNSALEKENKAKNQSLSGYNMPIIKLKENDKMPIIKPDSTINYHILKLELKNIKESDLPIEEK